MGKIFMAAGAAVLGIDLLAAAGFTVWLTLYKKKVKITLDDTYEVHP